MSTGLEVKTRLLCACIKLLAPRIICKCKAELSYPLLLITEMIALIKYSNKTPSAKQMYPHMGPHDLRGLILDPQCLKLSLKALSPDTSRQRAKQLCDSYYI